MWSLVITRTIIFFVATHGGTGTLLVCLKNCCILRPKWSSHILTALWKAPLKLQNTNWTTIFTVHTTQDYNSCVRLRWGQKTLTYSDRSQWFMLVILTELVWIGHKKKHSSATEDNKGSLYNYYILRLEQVIQVIKYKLHSWEGGSGLHRRNRRCCWSTWTRTCVGTIMAVQRFVWQTNYNWSRFNYSDHLTYKVITATSIYTITHTGWELRTTCSKASLIPRSDFRMLLIPNRETN
jgi:hypothetical protein